MEPLLIRRAEPCNAHNISEIYNWYILNTSEGSVGKGLGIPLYSTLIHSAAEKGFRELIGVIALPNAASVRLHTKLGFREIGWLEGVGRKFGSYIDVALWQRRISLAAPHSHVNE